MANNILKLTTEIVVAHSSVTELTSDQLVGEIKDVYNVLSSLEGGVILEEPVAPKPGTKTANKPPIPLKDIVKAQYVVSLECESIIYYSKVNKRPIA
jgi:predicted transcriptional regulator